MLLAAGSIAAKARSACHVWGAGFISRDNPIPKSVTWHAVRGPISRAMILNSGNECPAIYGDPALLTPRFISGNQRRGERIGLVLHYAHRKFVKSGDAKIISTERCGRQGVKDFINEILECNYVFSSSLHGLIFANSYGIPARWCILRRSRAGIGGDDMKFWDYWAGVGLNPQEPVNLGALKNFDENTLKVYRLAQPELTYDSTNLIESFPWPEKITKSR